MCSRHKDSQGLADGLNLRVREKSSSPGILILSTACFIEFGKPVQTRAEKLLPIVKVQEDLALGHTESEISTSKFQGTWWLSTNMNTHVSILEVSEVRAGGKFGNL